MNVPSVWIQDKITHFLSTRGINFHCNPPATPHQGGLWESSMKSAKYNLWRVMWETFLSLFTQIEAMLNSHPLTALILDPGDLLSLTPSHFLIGAQLAAIPEPNLQEITSN